MHAVIHLELDNICLEQLSENKRRCKLQMKRKGGELVRSYRLGCTGTLVKDDRA